jgi:hypothetical protein
LTHRIPPVLKPIVRRHPWLAQKLASSIIAGFPDNDNVLSPAKSGL